MVQKVELRNHVMRDSMFLTHLNIARTAEQNTKKICRGSMSVSNRLHEGFVSKLYCNIRGQEHPVQLSQLKCCGGVAKFCMPVWRASDFKLSDEWYLYE
jgi:hypothetical protein